MQNKDSIRLLVDDTEKLISIYKNTYPQNEMDCWRKRAPYLVFLSTLPVMSLAAFFHGIAAMFILFATIPMFYFSIVSIIRNIFKRRTNDKARIAAYKSLELYEPWLQYPDIKSYRDTTLEHLNDVVKQKKSARRKVRFYSWLILIAAYSLMVYLFSNLSYDSELFYSLQVEKNTEFQAVPYQQEGGISADSPKFTVNSNNHGYIYLEFSGLKFPDPEPSAVYMLRFVNPDGVPMSYLPEFIFSGQSVLDGSTVRSNKMDGDHNNQLPAYYTLSAIKSGNMYFTVEKIK